MEVFVKCVVSRENLLDWSRLWDDFTQKEIQEGSQGNGQKDGVNEENVVLSTKSKNKSKKDLSKVRCVACIQYGHYASQCPEKKKNKKEEDTVVAATAEEADFARRFEKEFSLFSFISSAGSNGVVQNGTWYTDSGASHHMIGI